MTDRGSFTVQSQALKDHATVWQDNATHADDAHTKISPAIGKGDDFGYLAGREGVSENYNQWTADMGSALQDASATFTYLYTALVSTARDYDGTDSTVATDMQQLDSMNNVR